MILLSACVITYNEETTLKRCLDSLQFADEVLVIDSGSTDRTTHLAQQMGVRVIEEVWGGFANQRNIALRHAQGQWVFFLDADEYATQELGQKLRQIAKEDPQQHPNCYSIKRIEYFLGRKLNYGPGNPSYQWRFFKRAAVQFEGQVHEYPKFEGPIGLVDGPCIHHWSSLGIDRFLNKLNRYTTLEALDRFAQGQRTTLLHAVGTFFTTFFKNGVRYQGFLNGKEGFILVLLESISRVVRHLKLWVFWQVYQGKLKIDLGLTLPTPGSVTPPNSFDLERPVWKKS